MRTDTKQLKTVLAGLNRSRPPGVLRDNAISQSPVSHCNVSAIKRGPLRQAREYLLVEPGFPLPLGHCGTPKDSAIKWIWPDDRAGASPMSKILNLSAHTSDDELQHITNLLLFHLVERCGGQIQFKLEDAHRVRE